MILTQAQILALVERSISTNPNIPLTQNQLELAFKIEDAVSKRGMGGAERNASLFL